MIKATLKAALLFAWCLLHTTAIAQHDSLSNILTNDLVVHPLRVDSFSTQSGFTGTDRDGIERSFTTEAILAAWTHSTTTPASLVSSSMIGESLLIELTDGQRLRVLIEQSNDPDIILGTRIDGGQPVGIPLDRVLTIQRQSNTDPEPSDDDLVILTNGDRLGGFISSVGPSLVLETDTNERTIRLDLIDTVQIQNPRVYTPGIYIHTAIGERIRVRDARFDQNRLLTIIPDDPIHLDAQDSGHQLESVLAAMERKPEGKFLINPTTSDPISIVPAFDRDWIPQPVTIVNSWAGPESTAIKIPSPAGVRWKTPAGSERLSVTIRTEHRPWTDNETSLIAIDSSGAETVIWSARLTSESGFQDINEPVPARTVAIEVRIDPGNYGPIQDRVWLLSPRLLVNGSPQFE